MLRGKILGKILLPFGLYLISSMVLTSPLLWHMTSHLPLGSEVSPTVPYFNLWSLGWNVNQFLNGLGNYWNAPIFYPVTGTFAFSDPQPLTGLLATLFWWLHPAFAYNMILLLFLSLNGFSVYHLCQNRGFSRLPAFLTGLMAQFLPYLTLERGVLQLQPFFGAVWAIDNLWSMGDGHRWKHGLGFGAALAITFLTSEYYCIFLSVLIPPALFFLLPHFKHFRMWASLLLGIALAATVILPVAIPQRVILSQLGFTRIDVPIRRYSAFLADYWHPPDEILASRMYPTNHWKSEKLFPGIMLTFLAIAGASAGLRRFSSRRWTLYLIIAGGIAFLVSAGPNFHIAEWRPYELVRIFMPGFDHLRSPYRMALFIQLNLALLAGQALHLAQRTRYAKLAFLMCALAILEFMPLPARLTPVPPKLTDSNIEGPAVFLPFAKGPHSADFQNTTRWMNALLPTGTKFVNGYSGYFPNIDRQLSVLLDDFPLPEGLTALRAMGVKTIITQEKYLNSTQIRRFKKSIDDGDLVPVASSEDVNFYRITGSKFKQASEYSGPWKGYVVKRRRSLEICMSPKIADESVFVMAPMVAALKWQIHLTSSHGRTLEYLVSPSGAMLFYKNSDSWLNVRIPRPSVSDQYYLKLSEAKTGKTLGAMTIDLH